MLLAIAQRMLNEQIKASTAARDRLAELAGRRFAVTIKGSSFRVVIEALDDSLRLTRSADPECDVELTAGALDLMKLAKSSSLSELKNSGASLNGNLHTAEAFSELLRLAVPEPEALLADWVGDMPARGIAQTARGARDWGRKASRSIERNVADYLQEESPALTPPALARQFSADVERLRDAVDRAAKRIELLERRLALQAGS